MGSIVNKYRVHEVAKDFGVPTKQITEILTKYAETPKNHMQVLGDRELSLIFESLTQHNQVSGIQAIYADAAKPAEKKAEPKAEKKPEAPKAEPAKAEAKPATKHDSKKNEQHKKREEKTVSLSELARETGAKAANAPAQAVSVRREDNQVTVDTRTVDMNVDRFDARYDDLASTKNTENRRKPTPQGNKQKFTQRGQRQRTHIPPDSHRYIIVQIYKNNPISKHET